MERDGNKLKFNQVEINHGRPFVREEMLIGEAEIALQGIERGAAGLRNEINELAMDTRHGSKAASLEMHDELAQLGQTILDLEAITLVQSFEEFLGKPLSD